MHQHPDQGDEFDHDHEVIRSATPGPWRVAFVDDDHAMNALLIVRDGASESLEDHNNNVAAVLLQTPRYVCLDDGRWHENAQFIALARERWPAALEEIFRLRRRVRELESELKDSRLDA